MGGGPTSATEKVLCIIPQKEPKEILQRIREKFPNVEITYIESSFGHNVKPTELPKDVYRDKTILVTLTDLPESQEEAPNLKLVHLYSAGADRAVKHPLFLETDIPFTNCSGVHGPQISEWIIMTLLLHKHSYIPMYEAQKRKEWDRQWGWNTRDLVGQRIGILGYGAIGRQTARVAKNMGMEVYAYTATPKDTPEKRADDGYYVPSLGDPDGSIPSKWYSGLDKPSLHEFLKQKLDVLVISVPLTPETRHFLSNAEFDILAAHPPLISNIGRGPIIDQPALVSALHAGKVAAATLDVTDPEPLPSDDPLWSAPNVIITPHISGASTAYNERAFQVLEVNLERLEKGEKLVNIIDRKKGY